MTDNELRELIKASTAQGQRALYDKYANYVYAVISKYLVGHGNREDIEDCFVETFTNIFQHIGDISGNSLKSYIGVAARNRALSYRKRLSRYRENTIPLEDISEPAIQHVEEQHEHKNLQQQLMLEIKELGEPDSTILIQKYFYGRKMAEISEIIGLSVNATQVRCSRALKQLRKRLSDWR